jgi:hypothetical protein
LYLTHILLLHLKISLTPNVKRRKVTWCSTALLKWLGEGGTLLERLGEGGTLLERLGEGGTLLDRLGEL